MGGLTRQIRFTGSRLKLSGLTPEHALDTLEPWLNQVRDRLMNHAVVIPDGDLSVDPEDHELVFSNGKLYLAVDGEYHVLWPVSAAELPAEVAAVVEAARELFLYREHDVEFAYAAGVVNATTDVVAAVAGKQLCIKRVKVCNPDTDSAKTFHFNWGSATTDNLDKGLLDKNGGTHIESFIGAPMIGGAGEKFTVTVSNDGSSSLHVTVGYLVLEPGELV